MFIKRKKALTVVEMIRGLRSKILPKVKLDGLTPCYINNRKALTVVEMMIVVALSFMVINIIANTFFSNIHNVKSGEKINLAEFEKFMIWKDISTNIMIMQPKNYLDKDGYNVSTKAEIALSNKQGDGFSEMKLTSYSFPEGFSSLVTFVIEGSVIKKIVDGRDYVLSEDFNEGVFTYQNNLINLDGVIKIQTELTDKPYEVDVNLNFEINKRDIDVVIE